MYADITLEMGDYDEIASPGIIASGGLGPCIAIGIYDKKTRIGYMIHEANADHSDSVESFIDSILKKSLSKNLEVYVTGGELLSKDCYPDNVNDRYSSRNFVKALITRKLTDSKVIIDWNVTSDNYN